MAACWQHACPQSGTLSSFSALTLLFGQQEGHPPARIRGFLNGMRYINPRCTYLLTYLLTYCKSTVTIIPESLLLGSA